MKIDLVTLNYGMCSKEWKLLEKMYSKFKCPAFFEGIASYSSIYIEVTKKGKCFCAEAVNYFSGCHA